MISSLVFWWWVIWTTFCHFELHARKCLLQGKRATRPIGSLALKRSRWYEVRLLRTQRMFLATPGSNFSSYLSFPVFPLTVLLLCIILRCYHVAFVLPHLSVLLITCSTFLVILPIIHIIQTVSCYPFKAWKHIFEVIFYLSSSRF
jgi:hypothetical protein